MSGQQKLNRITRDKKVVAIPTRKKEVAARDMYGHAVTDKNGNEVTETVQLYRIKPIR